MKNNNFNPLSDDYLQFNESYEVNKREVIKRLFCPFQDSILLAMEEEAVPDYMQEDIFNEISEIFNQTFDNE